MNKKWFFLILLIFCITRIQGKTKKFGTWIEAEATKDIVKKLEFSIKPEVRLQDDFSVDEYLVDGELTFKPVKFLHFSAAYRFSQDVKKSGNETFHRFALKAQAKKEWNRLESAFRLLYTNYSEIEDESVKNNYLRYRLKFEYDIKNCKLRPFASYELFHLTAEKRINKGRFDMGATYKLSDKSKVGLYYRLQSYFSDKNAIHIVGLSYKLSL